MVFLEAEVFEILARVSVARLIGGIPGLAGGYTRCRKIPGRRWFPCGHIETSLHSYRDAIGFTVNLTRTEDVD